MCFFKLHFSISKDFIRPENVVKGPYTTISKQFDLVCAAHCNIFQISMILMVSFILLRFLNFG